MTIIAYMSPSSSSGVLECSHPGLLDEAQFRNQLAQLSQLSAIAQDLKVPITSYEKLLSTDVVGQVLLVYVDTAEMTRYLKFGIKQSLYFYRPPKGTLVQIPETLCLLDFYVQEHVQRGGIGKKLFDEFLRITGVPPGRIAYDRPSPKLLPFLSKHYALTSPDLQPNRYTIFPRHFFG
eukprot:gene28038-33856_t